MPIWAGAFILRKTCFLTSFGRPIISPIVLLMPIIFVIAWEKGV